jgi:hypothetical protein
MAHCVKPHSHGHTEVVCQQPTFLQYCHPSGHLSAALQDAMGSVRLAGRLLRERAKGGASPWAPYISVLPHQVPAMVESFQVSE